MISLCAARRAGDHALASGTRWLKCQIPDFSGDNIPRFATRSFRETKIRILLSRNNAARTAAAVYASPAFAGYRTIMEC